MTSFVTPSAPPTRMTRLLPLAAVALAGLLGGALAFEPAVAIAAVVLSVLALICSRSPLASYFAVAFSLGLVGSQLSVSVLGLQIRVADVVGAVAVSAVLARRYVTRLRPGSPARRVVAWTCAAVFTAALLGGLTANPWSQVRADLYVAAFFVVGWLVTTEVAESATMRHRFVAIMMVMLCAVAAKELVLASLHIPLAGPGSLLQAWSFPSSGGWRTILVGGDTFLVIGPGFLAGAMGRERQNWPALLAVSGLCLVAILQTGTRTALAGSALGLCVGMIVARTGGRRRAARGEVRGGKRGLWPVGVIAVASLLLVGGWQGGWKRVWRAWAHGTVALVRRALFCSARRRSRPPLRVWTGARRRPGGVWVPATLIPTGSWGASTREASR